MQTLSDLLEFISLTHRFRQVRRSMLAVGDDYRENDAEHSYQLAMVAWQIIDSHGLGLNAGAAMRMALVHDLVEVYAGDASIYSAERAKKQALEEEAARRLAEEFSSFPEMIATLQEYRDCQTREARFVYALDKLLPALNNYLDGGRSWKREQVTLERFLEAKTAKISASPELVPLYEELVGLLRKNPELFSDEN